MPKSDFGLDALAALEQNDAHELIKIFRKSGAGAINATVQGDMYAGSGAFGRLKREEGDTMLHMALRNQKWLIRTACHGACGGLHHHKQGGRLGTGLGNSGVAAAARLRPPRDVRGTL